jgi:hypothetical protein
VLAYSGPISERQAAADRRQWKVWDRQIKRQARAKIGELREQIRSVKRSRKGRAAEVRALCRRTRLEHRAARLEQRERARRERDELRARGLELRAECRRRREGVPVEIAEELRELARQIAEAREIIARPTLGASRGDSRTAAERRAEAEDEVRGNLPAELLPVWEARRTKIKAGPRQSLTEAFLQWTHENSAEVAEILYADEREHLRAIERDERALSREYAKIQRTGARPSKRLREALEAAGVELEAGAGELETAGEWGG